jgi:hypothetical protein
VAQTGVWVGEEEEGEERRMPKAETTEATPALQERRERVEAGWERTARVETT